MAQTIIRVVILIGFPLVIAVLVYLVRGQRASRKAGSQLLEALAAEMATTYRPSWAQPHLDGIYAGRHCILQEVRDPGSDRSAYVLIRVACGSLATFELFRSKPALVTLPPPDMVQIGDSAFDQFLNIRSSDAGRVSRMLTTDLRARLLQWFRDVSLELVRLKDGYLELHGGYGFREKRDVERAKLLLGAGVEMAEGLER